MKSALVPFDSPHDLNTVFVLCVMSKTRGSKACGLESADVFLRFVFARCGHLGKRGKILNYDRTNAIERTGEFARFAMPPRFRYIP